MFPILARRAQGSQFAWPIQIQRIFNLKVQFPADTTGQRGNRMGAWGAGLYQSDAALDVRNVYRDFKKIGLRSGDLASVVLETAAIDPAAGQEDSAPAYLALADMLWKDGMLSHDIRRTALRIIGDTSLHPRWDEAAMNQKQRAVFDALATKLAAPQPSPSKVQCPLYLEQCDFEIGEVLAFPWPEGKWTLLNVVAYFTRFRGKSAICEVLDWRKRTIPPAPVIEGLPLRKQRDVVIFGSARPKETVKELIEAGRLPAGATWNDFEEQMTYPTSPSSGCQIATRIFTRPNAPERKSRRGGLS